MCVHGIDRFDCKLPLISLVKGLSIYTSVYIIGQKPHGTRGYTLAHTHIVAFPLMTLRTEQIIGGNRIGSQIQLCFQLAPKSALS